MTNRTKLQLEEAFKKLLLEKPFHKITIKDLTDACYLSRMSFYYHFQDLYDLTEWILIEDAKKALNEKKDYAHWKEGLENIFEAVYKNKPFILNVYHDISKDQIEKVLFKLVHGLIESIVEERSIETNLNEQQKNFIAYFYKYGFVGILQEWIEDGMKEEPEIIIKKLNNIIEGDFKKALEKMQK